MSFPDISPEAALPRFANAPGSQRIPYRDGVSQDVAATEVEHDYTEGATQGEIEEVLRQHKAEEVALLGESAMGMGDEGPNDGKSNLRYDGCVKSRLTIPRPVEATNAIWDGPAAHSVSRSFTSMHGFMERARRSSISSNRPSFGDYRRSQDHSRPSFDYRRSQNGSMRSRSNTGHYSEDGRPGMPRHISGRSHQTTQSQAVDDEDWPESPGADDTEEPDEAAGLRSPGILPRIASAFGFGKLDDKTDDGLGRRRSRSIGSRGARSRRSSHVSSRSRGESADASEYMSDGTESWGYTSNEDDQDTSSLISDRGEGGEEGYSSSLADDTSLPPNSRPSSPPMPLLPSDGIFGDPHPELQNSQIGEPFAGPDTAYRQTIVLPDEDLKIRFTGYVTDTVKSILWFIGCVLSFGVLGLIGRWVPKAWIGWVGKATEFNKRKDGAWAVVEVSGIVSLIVSFY